MVETEKVLISPCGHHRNGVTFRQVRGIERFLKPNVIEAESNEEFLDQIASIFVQQAMAMQEEEQAQNRREVAASDPNS